MSSDSPSTRDRASPQPEGQADPTGSTDDSRSPLVNALIGAAVGIVLSFVPFSPALGGGVAGYLEGGESDDGLKVGVLAGAVMAVPLTLLGLLVVLFVFGVAGAAVGIGVFVLLFVLLLGVYTVGLGALGGLVGVALEDDL